MVKKKAAKKKVAAKKISKRVAKAPQKKQTVKAPAKKKVKVAVRAAKPLRRSSAREPVVPRVTPVTRSRLPAAGKAPAGSVAAASPAIIATTTASVNTEAVATMSASAPAPNRAPMRRVMRDDRSIVVVTDRVEPTQIVSVSMVIDPSLAEPVPSVRAVSMPDSAAVFQTPEPQAERREILLPKLPPVAWSHLPAPFPVQSRFYLSMAEKECRAAASWPFPFARFLSSLPEQMCARGLALLLMALEHSVDYIANVLQEEVPMVEARLARERSELLERCSTHCPEMYRKMKMQLGGVGISIESLVDQYLVSRVDRSFQLTIGAIILQSLAE